MNYNSFLFKHCKYIDVVVNDRRIRNSDPSNYKKKIALLHSFDYTPCGIPILYIKRKRMTECN